MTDMEGNTKVRSRFLWIEDLRKFKINVKTHCSLEELFPTLPDDRFSAGHMNKIAAEIDRFLGLAALERTRSRIYRRRKMHSVNWKTETLTRGKRSNPTIQKPESDILFNLTNSLIRIIMGFPELRMADAFDRFRPTRPQRALDVWYFGGERIHTLQAGKLGAQARRLERTSAQEIRPQSKPNTVLITPVAAHHVTPRCVLPPSTNITLEISRMIGVYCKRPWRLLKYLYGDASGENIQLSCITIHGQYLHVARLQIPVALLRADLNALPVPKQLYDTPIHYLCSREFDILDVDERNSAYQHILAILEEHVANDD
ncbi:hypothetical protein Dda_3242 [Drechslerella dactyloides]|uniref:Uncharacterized protein n=1 Tax=Drechslerella dactyloides TaxID=74499 RepID=A0AAD6NL24_DREDA|nr:hypothetical protein Dda_3242 [Drechslerella dactyloides]